MSKAQQALDKMAENARELGLDYEPVSENFMDALKFDVAMREALAEQPAQQKPVAWMDIDENGTFSGLRYWSESDNRHEVALYTSPPAQQEPVFAIRLLTNQCFALAQERDELQKQVWRYEKNGVTCQTYRHKVDASCSECNVHEVYTSPPAQRTWVGLTDEEIAELMTQIWSCASIPPRERSHRLARAIEAKLKEKNNG